MYNILNNLYHHLNLFSFQISALIIRNDETYVKYLNHIFDVTGRNTFKIHK